VEATPVHEYSAESARQGLVAWLGSVRVYPRLLIRHRGLIWNFFRRELLGRFRGSSLGVLWVLVQPVFLFVLYYAMFGILFGPRLPPPNQSTPDPEFAAFIFAGVLAWGAYVEGASRACTVVVDNGNLVKKVAFPCEILPVHPVLTACVVQLVGVAVMLVFGACLGIVKFTPLLATYPLVLAVHFVFTLGVGLGLATVQVFMRDASHLLGIVNQALMFASGTFISTKQLEDQWPGVSGWVTWLPWYHLLQSHRLALGVEPYEANGPSLWGHLLPTAAWAVGFLLLGYSVFMSRRHKFADLV
jgi:lipopolysaccharide transport system permease protein